MIDWLFRDRRDGRLVVAQLPNLPLVLFLVTSVVLRIARPHGTVAGTLRVIAAGSLLWWAADEIVRGVNPFRRILGAVVAVLTIVGLVVR